MESPKLISVSIAVPYHGSGGIITNKPVAFDILQQENTYKAVPQLHKDERRIANLPEELVFFLENGKPKSVKGARDGNMHVIDDIVKELKKIGIFQ